MILCKQTEFGEFRTLFVLRKMRDSNPRYPEKGIPDFESSAFGHAANLPLLLHCAKVIIIFILAKKYYIFCLRGFLNVLFISCFSR